VKIGCVFNYNVFLLVIVFYSLLLFICHLFITSINHAYTKFQIYMYIVEVHHTSRKKFGMIYNFFVTSLVCCVLWDFDRFI
jgi:hypothetical protein